MNNDRDGYDMLSKRHLFTKSKAGANKFHCPNCGKNDFEVKPSDGTYKCFSTGCSSANIRSAIDKLEGKPDWKPESKSKSVDRPTKAIRKRSRIDYFYPDRDGNDLIRVRRDDDGDGKKKFTQAHWTGSAWEFTNPSEIRCQIPIYRYAEVRAAIANSQLVFIVEGESAADALWDSGIPATTTIGGSGGFSNFGNYGDDFDGGKFVLSPDCDKGGIKYMTEVAMCLGDKVHGYYLAGSNPDLWIDPVGGFDIKDDITDRHLDRDRILASVISADEYRKILNPIPPKPVGRPRKSVDESAEKKEKTPARDLITPILENVYRDVVRYDADLDRYWHYSEGLWSCCANSYIYTLVQKYLIEIEEPYTARLIDEVVKLSRGFIRDAKWVEVDVISHIPFTNGVLEIATKTLLPHSPSYEFRWQLPREYSPVITGWNRIKLFLDETSGGNSQLRNILLAFCNKALTGRCGSPKFLYLSGSGGNGKGVFLELLEGLVGKANTKTTSLASLNDNRFEPANIRDKRVVICADEDRKPDSLTVFKSATGGDNISCEYKGKQAIDFKYEGIFVVAANKPIFQGENHEAMKRRKVDFPCLHQPPKKDPHLIKKLLVELPQFTTYVLGLDPIWVEETIAQSDKVDAIASLAREMSIQENNVAGYYYSQLVVDPESSASTLSLYKNYEAYCNENNLKPCNGNRFPKMLWELCNHSLKIAIGDKRIANVRHFTGIRMATPLDVLPDDADLMPTSADLGAESEPLLLKPYADYADLFNEKLITSNKLNNKEYIEGEIINLYIGGSEKVNVTQHTQHNEPHNDYTERLSADFSTISAPSINHADPSINSIALKPGDRIHITKYNENGTVEAIYRNDPPIPHGARVIRDSGKPCLLDILPGHYKLITEPQ